MGGEELVEQHAGACADLPFGDPQAGEVGGGGGVMGISGRDEKPLFAPPQVQQVWAAVAKQGTGEGRVVDAAVVTQVDGCAISGAPGQRTQSLEASAGADWDYRRPTCASTTCKAGSSLPASRNTRSASSKRAAAIAASVATMARRRSARVITSASATAERAAVAAFAPDELRGSAFGLLATMQAIGNLAASAVAGLLYTVTTTTVAFTYLAGWMLIALAALGWAAAPARGDYGG